MIIKCMFMSDFRKSGFVVCFKGFFKFFDDVNECDWYFVCFCEYYY